MCCSPIGESPSSLSNVCENCGVTIDTFRPRPLLCDVCLSLLKAVQREFFIQAHKDWESENEKRIAIKQRLREEP